MSEQGEKSLREELDAAIERRYKSFYSMVPDAENIQGTFVLESLVEVAIKAFMARARDRATTKNGKWHLDMGCNSDEAFFVRLSVLEQLYREAVGG